MSTEIWPRPASIKMSCYQTLLCVALYVTVDQTESGFKKNVKITLNWNLSPKVLDKKWSPPCRVLCALLSNCAYQWPSPGAQAASDTPSLREGCLAPYLAGIGGDTLSCNLSLATPASTCLMPVMREGSCHQLGDCDQMCCQYSIWFLVSYGVWCLLSGV